MSWPFPNPMKPSLPCLGRVRAANLLRRVWAVPGTGEEAPPAVRLGPGGRAAIGEGGSGHPPNAARTPQGASSLPSGSRARQDAASPDLF
jgi:hypothetical protein